MNARTLTRIALSFAALATVGLAAQACVPLEGAQQQAADALALSLVGAQPDAGYGDNGQVSFSMFARDTSTNAFFQESLQSRGMDVRVKNDDGSFSDCDYVGSDVEEGSDFNTLSMLVDDSGSMGLEFPVDIYDDLCPTCPHDPKKLRGEAASTLAQEVFMAAPESRIALMTFGPTVDEGYLATHVLTDFTGELEAITSAISGIDGETEAGTPLWDSLADVIGVTDTEGDEYQDILQSRFDMDPAPTEEMPEVARVVVVISDGDDRDSQANTLQTVIQLATETNTRVFAIGLGPASVKALLQTDGEVEAATALQELASATGGFYASVNDAEGLKQLYAEVATTLTQGYQVETYSCKPKATADAPNDTRRVPMTGEKVEGDVAVDGGERKPWAMVAP